MLRDWGLLKFGVLGCLAGASLMVLDGVANAQVQDSEERQQVQAAPIPVPVPDEQSDSPEHQRADTADQDHNESGQSETFWQWASADPVAFFTLWLALFTSVLAVSTIGLWIVTWRAHRRNTRDTEILQRAYLSVDGLGFLPFGATKSLGNSIAHISVRNVGRLPARGVKWLIDYKLDPSGRLDDFPIDESRTPFYGNNVIPPGTEMKRSKNCRFTAEEVDGFKRNNLTLYVWGEVRYTDGFSKERFTRFCHRYPRNGLDLIKSGRLKGQNLHRCRCGEVSSAR